MSVSAAFCCPALSAILDLPMSSVAISKTTRTSRNASSETPASVACRSRSVGADGSPSRQGMGGSGFTRCDVVFTRMIANDCGFGFRSSAIVASFSEMSATRRAILSAKSTLSPSF